MAIHCAAAERGVVATANALQLEAALATPALSRFNYDLRRHAKFEVAEPIHCRIIAFWPWPLTFDLKHLQRIVRDVVKLCTKFERNRAIRGGVIAISVFELMTLNMFEVLRSALG